MTPAPPTIRAFGPLRVMAGGVEQEIRRRRERNVLAVLLSQQGELISADRLVQQVWGLDAPREALGSLQVAIARLRGILEPERPARAPATVLISSAIGYRLALDDPAVDVWDFAGRALAAIGSDATASGDRRDPSARLRVTSEALASWSGDPYTDCDAEPAVREAERLADLRLAVAEINAQARLDLGDPVRAATDLAPLLAENPYRERLWALSALADYRCARQGKALDTIRTLRRRLAEDLGIDPTSEIATLESAILAQDQILQGPPRPLSIDRPAVDSGPFGSGTSGLAARSMAVPASVPDSRDTTAGPVEIGSLGRDDALAAVRALLDRLVAEETGGFLVISGEPGIGKSRLAQDLTALAGLRGARVVAGRCHADFAPALWRWLPVVRDLVGDAPEPTGDTHLILPQAAGIAVDPLAPLLSISASSAVAVDRDAGSMLRLFDAVRDLLTRAASGKPLVVVLEDLHWADTTSLRLLAHLATSGVAGPVLIVATIRTGEGSRPEPLVAAMAAMSRASASRIRLDGLGAESVGALLSRMIEAHDPRLDAVVSAATGGNPFFVLEYAHLLQARDDLAPGRFDPTALPIPDGIADVLHQRVERLPRDAATTLRIAALTGPAIDPGLVAEITGSDVDDILDHLDLALAAGILTERPSGYGFSHALTREVLAAELSAGRRIRLHDRIARVLLESAGDDPDRAAEIAHHAYQAAALGPEQASRAAPALERATAVAETRQAFDESLALWRRASDTINGPQADLRQVPDRLGEARSLFRLARYPEARAVVAEAVIIAGDGGRWSLVGQGAAILNRSGVWSWSEHEVLDEPFAAALESAVGWVDNATGARILAALARIFATAGRQDKADDFGMRAQRVARLTGDDALLAEVLFASAMSSFGPGKVAQRLRYTTELTTMQLRGELAVYADFVHGQTLFASARVDEADAVVARCRAALADLHHSGIEIPMLWWRLARARDRDDLAEADAVLAEMAAYHDRGLIVGAGLDVLFALHSRPPGTPLDDESLRSARVGQASLRARVAFEAMETGRDEDARNLIGPPPAPGAAHYAVLAAYCLRIAVHASGGPGRVLDDELGFLRAHAGAVVVYGTVEHLGAVDYFIALGDLARGDLASSRRHLESARDLLQRMDIRPWLRRADALAARLDADIGTG
jgi:DNA-binding SARP family transcriptional activator